MRHSLDALSTNFRTVWLITPFPPEGDSRAHRLRDFLEASGLPVEIVSVEAPRKPASSRLEKLAIAIKRRLQLYAATARLVARIPRKSSLITVNCETTIIAAIIGLLLFKRNRHVADIYDHHGFIVSSYPAALFFHLLEAIAVILSGRAIIPVRQRLAQYPAWLRRYLSNNKALFISNRGFILDLKRNQPSETTLPSGTNVIRIGYFGTIDDSRGIDILIDAVAGLCGKVELHIHGDGSSLQRIQNRGHSMPNVHVGGPYRHTDLVRLAANVDLLWAAYDLVIPNNRFCDPNKFKEHIELDRPLVTNPGHPLAEEVEKSGSGFVVPLDVSAVARFLETLTPAQLAARRPGAQGLAASMLAASVDDNRAEGRKVVEYLSH